MKLFVSLILVVLFTVSAGVAQENDEEWVTVKKSQLMAWRDQLLVLQSMVEIYSARITMLQMEVLRLQSDSMSWEKKYENEKKGLFVGFNAGYPFLSADFIVMYKFSKFGIYSMIGYNTAFTVNLGVMARVSK